MPILRDPLAPQRGLSHHYKMSESYQISKAVSSRNAVIDFPVVLFLLMRNGVVIHMVFQIHETARQNVATDPVPGNNTSGLPPGCSVNNARPMAPNCQFLNENDGSLQYSDGWTFTTSDPNGFIHTLHFTNFIDASVSLQIPSNSSSVFVELIVVG